MRSATCISAAGLVGSAGTGFTRFVVRTQFVGRALEASGAVGVEKGTRIRAGQGEFKPVTSGTAGCGRIFIFLKGTRRAGVAKVVLIRWSDNHVVSFWTASKGLTAYDTGASRVPVGGPCAKLTAGGLRRRVQGGDLRTSGTNSTVVRIGSLLVGPRRARLAGSVGFPPFIRKFLTSGTGLGYPRRALCGASGREGTHRAGLACIRIVSKLCCTC